MFEAIATVLLGIVFAVCAVWVAQHVLGTMIGWGRAVIIVALVYALTVPLVRAALESGDVMSGGEFIVSSPMGIVFIAVALGWQFAISVATIMISELLWPSGRGWHPIRAVKGALSRRKRFRRYAHTLRIFSKHGLSLYDSHRRHEDQDVPTALVAAMNEAGVTFVKVGQVLSTRDDILPKEFTDAFATLQMHTPPLPWEAVRAAIETELGRPIDEAFAWVDEKPLAAASIAQVHCARLHPIGDETEGADVVIKVQRPEARESVLTDCDIIVRLAAQAERRTPWARAYGLVALADEFVRSLREELDYRIELANTELLRGTLSRSESAVTVPQVWPELCTERMMVQEHVTGTPFATLHGSLPWNESETTTDVRSKDFAVGDVDVAWELTTVSPRPTARDVADVLVDSVFEQVALRGVFHADLHPGNVILGDDGSITLIDFGSIGILERSLRRVLVAMMSAIDAEDDIALTDLLLMVVGKTSDGSDIDRPALQHQIGVILTRIQNGKTDSSIFGEVIDVLREHRLAMPPALVLVFRTIASLEGTLRHLVVDYDMVGRALSRTPHFVHEMVSVHGMVKDAQTQLQVVGEQLRRLPRRIEVIGSQLENGTFGLSMKMFRDPKERSWVGGLVGQLTTTLVGVALLITAVLLLVSDGGPNLTPDVSFFPFLGTIVGLGGMLLVLRALRSSLSRAPR